MKILMLTASLNTGGAETHICELASALTRKGERVCVVSAGGKMTELLKNSGIRHVSLPLDKKSPLSLLKAYSGLMSLTENERFDVIHAHSRIAAYLGEKISLRRKIPFVTTVHAKFSLSPIKKYMSRWGYYVSAVGEDLAAYIRKEYGVNPDGIRIIPNGVDTRRFCAAADCKKDDAKRILFVSRLDRDCSDAAYSLCRISERLAERYPNIRIDIAGGGSEYPSLSECARIKNEKLGYRCINTLGRLNEPEKHMARSDVCVGVSRVLLEAMSCGVPVVLAGNEGFMGTLTEENINRASETNFCGRGGDTLDDERLFDALRAILDTPPEKSSALGSFLREYVKSNNGIDASAEMTIAFYKEALRSVSFCGGKVCLCGYYGFGNTGDDALLREAIKRARKLYGNEGISALTRSPEKDRCHFGIRCVSRSNIFKAVREISNSERLIFGGGSLFQDKTSLRSLLYYAFIAHTAFRKGVKVELWANGIGPLKRKISRRIMRYILTRAEYIGVRDRESEKIAAELGADKNKLRRERDLAFSAEPCGDKRLEYIFSSIGLKKNERFAVIGVSGKSSESTLNAITLRVKELAREGLRCVFIAMYPNEDKSLSLKLCRETNGKYAERLTGSELVGLLEKSEMCVGSRLHLLIFARAAGARFEGFGSDPKIISFCLENGGKVSKN
ncbi:MAG: glycosyltransferase [Clostridia bacterium]|nr:glycosyltransferase [Clostridia bacterium]